MVGQIQPDTLRIVGDPVFDQDKSRKFYIIAEFVSFV
jgi:hypothetical protein